MVMQNQINNLLYFIAKYNNLGIIHNRIKQINNDDFPCINEQERDIKRFLNSCNYIFSNINQAFNEELVNQSYYLLTNKLMNENTVKNIVEVYYKNIDNAPHTIAAIIHLTIINHIEYNNNEFAFIISNYIMLKKERWFLIPFEFCFGDYRIAVENNDISLLIRLFYDIEIVRKEKNACNYSFEEIVELVKKKHTELIQKFKVNSLYLFGSFAKGNNNNKSDLDFMVIFDGSLINIEKKNNLNSLKNYLKNCFSCDVDLLDFSYAMDTFDKSQM